MIQRIISFWLIYYVFEIAAVILLQFEAESWTGVLKVSTYNDCDPFYIFK